MNRIIRIGTILLTTLLLLILTIVIIVTVQIRRPFPQSDGTITLNGLQAEVNVYRDEFGVPHIYAQNEADLFFAQGYIHAQDRFWQMEFWRHISAGRISEIVGEPGIENDKYIRTANWPGIAATSLEYYQNEAPEVMAAVEAYSAGVNAYLAEQGDNLSINYTIMGLVGEKWEIEPWEPIHTIAWGVVMAEDLSKGHRNSELDRLKLYQTIGQETYDALQPLYPYDDRPVIAPTTDLLSHSDDQPTITKTTDPVGTTAVAWHNVSTQLIGAAPSNGFAFGAGPGIGSNSWVVHGDHTETGMPLLANDPHLGPQMPAIWYEVGLHAPGWDVAGFSFAGVPGIVIGHNNSIAWGLTNINPDVIDLYIEKVNPDNPNQYEFMGEWRDMINREEVIKVNGGEDVVITVRETHHGPIINEVVQTGDELLAMRWAAQEGLRNLHAIYLYNQAENFDEFRQALQFFDVPAQNFIYADTDGNIGYQMPGLVPIRQNGDGLAPVPGWTGDYEWTDWIPYEAFPTVLNPQKGYISTANHAVIDADYPYHITYYWASGDRGQRIVDMLEAHLAEGPITTADFAEMHYDSYSMLAANYVPLFRNITSTDGRLQDILTNMQDWDYQLRRDSVPAAIFEVFYKHLVYNTLSDDIGTENVSDLHSRVLFHDLSQQPDSLWWDDTTTTRIETQSDIIRQSLIQTITWFEENVGENDADWTWGTIHTLTFVSIPIGQSGIGPLESLVNIGPYSVDGGGSIVNANAWDWDQPARVIHHPSMRMIVDMNDFNASQAILPTGQSGHPNHVHYDDMAPLWVNGDYHPMHWGRTNIEETAVAHLTLSPNN